MQELQVKTASKDSFGTVPRRFFAASELILIYFGDLKTSRSQHL